MNFWGWGTAAALTAGAGFGGGYAAGGLGGSKTVTPTPKESDNQVKDLEQKNENINDRIKQLENQLEQTKKDLNGQIKTKEATIQKLTHDGKQMLNMVTMINMVSRNPAHCAWWDTTRNKYWDYTQPFKFGNETRVMKYTLFGCLPPKK